MDYTTLLSGTPLMLDEANLPLTSLYEALQELPDMRRAEAQTVLVGVDPLLSRSRQISRSDKFKGS